MSVVEEVDYFLIELYLLLSLIIRIFANLYLPYVQTELQGKMTNY